MGYCEMKTSLGFENIEGAKSLHGRIEAFVIDDCLASLYVLLAHTIFLPHTLETVSCECVLLPRDTGESDFCAMAERLSERSAVLHLTCPQLGDALKLDGLVLHAVHGFYKV